MRDVDQAKSRVSFEAELVDAAHSGHINADSGHGPWPEGLMRFAGFFEDVLKRERSS